jgi:hypothetical protein
MPKGVYEHKHNVQHGTLGGHSWHRRRAEQPCAACAKARRLYERERRRIPVNRRKRQLEERARDAAHRVLRLKYRAEYREIYYRVMAQLEIADAIEQAEAEAIAKYGAVKEGYG